MNYVERLQQQYAKDVEFPPRMAGPVDEWVTWDVSGTMGKLFVEAAPGNGTVYRFMLLSISRDEAQGWGMPENAHLLAMYPGHATWKRTMSVASSKIHPNYIMEKLGMGLPDAVAMSIILYRVGEKLNK